jgi:ADP-ribosylglycohydrolase
MIGAILGDMIGAPYEFDRSGKTKEFPLFCRYSEFTDDSVMTIAVAEALMDSMGGNDDEIRKALVKSMQKWGHRYPNAGYGGMFYRWLRERNPRPYGSFGNGSAMRVSSAGWLFGSLEETRHMARLTAEVTHNHPEGIKGAEAAASAIFLARTGKGKKEIKDYIVSEFGYDLSRTCDQIRPGYHHVETCQKTVPEAVTAFLEGNDFEDVIRTAVSLGGDCDTLTCIAGGMAEAFYGVPEDIAREGRKRLPHDMLEVLDRFEELRKRAESASDGEMFTAGNILIEEAIRRYYDESSRENLGGVLEAIRQRMHKDGHFIVPVTRGAEENSFSFRQVRSGDGKFWQAVFTSRKEFEKGEAADILSHFMDSILKAGLDMDGEGFIINPWGQSFMLPKDLIKMIFDADGDTQYHIPDVPITEELLKDGSFLKNALEICSRNRTQLNLIRLAAILRDSFVWIPCNAILSDADYDTFSRVVLDAADQGNLDSLTGRTLTSRDPIRMVPDILQSGDDFFFPVFTSEEEMGTYGENFSKVERSFPEAAILAGNNEKNMKGIVINAFTDLFVIPTEMIDFITGLPSRLYPDPE